MGGWEHGFIWGDGSESLGGGDEYPYPPWMYTPGAVILAEKLRSFEQFFFKDFSTDYGTYRTNHQKSRKKILLQTIQSARTTRTVSSEGPRESQKYASYTHNVKLY